MKDIRICFFGDSFINGTGDLSYLGWTGRACAAVVSSHAGLIGLTYYNLGVRGNSSEQVEARWPAEAALRFATECEARLVFAFGTCDNLTQAKADPLSQAESFFIEPRNSVACARRILTRAIAQHPTLLIGPPPVADKTLNQRNQASSKAYEILASELSVPYLDVYTPLRENEIWMAEVTRVDGYHPAAAGYQALAQLVSSWTAWQAWFA